MSVLATRPPRGQRSSSNEPLQRTGTRAVRPGRSATALGSPATMHLPTPTAPGIAIQRELGAVRDLWRLG